MESPELQLISGCLEAYDLGGLKDCQRHGGTAGKTWTLATSRGTWLLRMRGVRTSSDQIVAFDHGLRRYMVERGVPTAAPVATRVGSTFIRIDGRTFEVYPLIVGVCLRTADGVVLSRVAQTLARFHQAVAEYPAARSLPPVAQYSTLGFGQESDRMEDPDLLAAIYSRLALEPDAKEFSDAVAVSQRWLERLSKRYDRTTYDRLPHTVTHGDFTLANLLFDEKTGQVNGIFDLDWARWAPRIRDIADGMSAIAGQRQSPLCPGDIWSLTAAPCLEVERCVGWLQSYQGIAALTPAEVRLVPLALAARWLSIRIEGMAKVPASERLRFCFGNLAGPLLWLEAHWAQVERVLISCPNPG